MVFTPTDAVNYKPVETTTELTIEPIVVTATADITAKKLESFSITEKETKYYDGTNKLNVTKVTVSGNGTVSPSGWVRVRDGLDQTFTITPDRGCAVAKVLVDGRNVGAVTSYTLRDVTEDHTIQVIFMKANGNPQTGVFVDVAEGSYYEEAIDWAVENGITQGTDDTHFSPDGICTRAQAVTFLWRCKK